MRNLIRTVKNRQINFNQFYRFCVLKKFTQDHEWVSLENDIVFYNYNQATVGITDHAQSELGDIVHVDLPKIGTNYNQGDSLGAIESVKTAADVYSPLTGVVADVNDTLERKPKLLNQHPYTKGWYAKLKVDRENALKVLESLMTEEAYIEMVQKSKN